MRNLRLINSCPLPAAMTRAYRLLTPATAGR
jgi:hypothetical protein